MTLQLVLATALILAAGWVLPRPFLRYVPLPHGAVTILCTMLLFGAGVVIMLAMDTYGLPLRFTDPSQEGAFLFSAVSLTIPGCVALMTRLAMLKGTP